MPKLKLTKLERPNYWHIHDLSIVYKAQSGKIMVKSQPNRDALSTQIAYNAKIDTLWRNIYHKINTSVKGAVKFDSNLTNLINSNSVDFRFPIYESGNLYFIKIENLFYKVHKKTLRKMEVSTKIFNSQESVLVNFDDFDIKHPGSQVLYQ